MTVPASAAPAFSLGRRRAIFVATVSGYILSQFYRSFLTVIIDDLQRELGVGPRELGILGSSWFFAFAFAQFPVGILLDRFGPRRTIAGMMGFAVIGAILFANASSVLIAALAMALIGIGCAPVLMGTLFFFAKVEPPGRFALLSSLFLGVGLAGGLLAARPLVVLTELVGWRGAMLVMAAISMASLVLIAVIMRDPPQDNAGSGDDAGLFGALIILMRRPVMWPILFMSFLISAQIFTERALWIGPYFGEVYGLDARLRGDIILLFALAMSASAMVAGPLAKALDDPKLVVVISMIGSGLGFLALGLMPQAPLPLAIGIMLLTGFLGVSYAVQMAHARLFMPAHVIGRGITFINFVSIGGTGVAQYLSGQAMQGMRDAGLPAPQAFGWLHLVFGLCLLLGTAVYAFAPKKPV